MKQGTDQLRHKARDVLRAARKRNPGHLMRHKRALKLYAAGQPVAAISLATKLSRQTVWRIVARSFTLPGPRGGRRKGRCKIPAGITKALNLRIRFFLKDGESYAEKAVTWLKKYHNIVVTPAAIYSFRFRQLKPGRLKRAPTQTEEG